MKTIFNLLYIALVCLCLHACDDNKEETLHYSIDQTDVVLENGKAGSTDILMMTNTDQVSATVAGDCQEWLAAEVTRRCLTLNYKQNDSGVERTGTVTLHIGTENVTVTVLMPPYFEEEEGQQFSIGDVYYEEGKAVGVIFWVDKTDKTIAKAVSLDRLGGAWSTEGTAFIGAYSMVDGQTNTTLIRNSNEGKSGSIPALEFCDAHGEGWYWPAIEELKDLFTAYNGRSFDEASKTPGGDDQEKIARAKFDKIFTDNGGTAIDLSTSGNGESYWASTEDNSDESYAKYGCNFRFYVPAVNMGAGQCKKTGTKRFIRCVKVIGNYTPGPEPVVVSIKLDKENVTLEGVQNSEQTVTATITNGSIYTATPADNSWCSATVSANTVTIKATSDNDSGKTRETTVLITVKGTDEKDYTISVSVSQKALATPVVDYTVGSYYEQGDTKGVVFWVSEDGKTAKIVSLERTETTEAWSTEQKSYNVTDEDNGVANTTTLIKEGEEKVPAIKLCKNGWYWPAINELKALFEAYNGTTFDKATNATPDKITDAEKTAREVFDKVLTDHGGVKLNTATTGNGDQYWGSTELNDLYGSYLRFGKRYCGALADTPIKTATNKRYIRCIKQIGKDAKSPL